MTGITKDELMQMARESGLEFCEEESAHSVYVSLAQFTNAILERAAVEAQEKQSRNAWHVIRALKINTGD